MTLTRIAVAAAAALLYSWLLPGRWRGWALMLASIVAIYWLGTPLAIRYLDFILPTATLVLTVLVWLFVRDPEAGIGREDWMALGASAALVLGLSATRYLVPELRPTPSRAPDVLPVALGLLLAGGAALGLWRVLGGRRGLLSGAIAFVVLLFILLKTEPLTIGVSRLLRELAGQQADLARVSDVAWLGFSYVAFRLIHMLRDRQTGRLPALSLREALTYVLFFPAYTAGPIDRAERFVADYRALPGMTGPDAARLTVGTSRILVGILKKFVIADSLVLLSLNATNATQAGTTAGLWVLLYGYALRLYLDFSGYTDIAIGLGILYGLRLPENFNWPYLKQNIAAFWQSWHITLSNWVRFYVFSPLSRALMVRKPAPSPLLVVFVSQMATMLVIGLWHGVSWNFVAWGAWHGVGLFLHKWWSDRTRRWYLGLKDRPRLRQAWTVAGVLLTFQFVTLGWVWFALPDIGLAWDVFLRLLGIGA